MIIFLQNDPKLSYKVTWVTFQSLLHEKQLIITCRTSGEDKNSVYYRSWYVHLAG